MGFIKKHWLLFLSVFLVLLSIFIRYRIRGLTNIDTNILDGWYGYLYDNGFTGLSNETFSNYPPAYLYLLWFTTLFSNWIGALVSIKIIPTAFDFLSAYAVCLIARTKYRGDLPYLFGAVFLLLPTVILNSTGWGQIDSLYTSLLLLCFYFLLKKKPWQAFLAFGVAFSFKAQAIFLLPFLGILLLRRRVHWYHFLVVPVVYLTLALPAVGAGRSWESVIMLYAGQAGQYEELAKTAPNLYIFIPNMYYHSVLKIGMSVFAICMLAWAWINWRAGSIHCERQLALTALASVALVPFLLPKMHDRYFYPADVISSATALLIPKLWFLPALFQISSAFAYTIFLFGYSPVLVYIAAIINTALVVFIVLKQMESLGEDTQDPTAPLNTRDAVSLK